MRYKNDMGQFPESLDTLVAAGYLQSIPSDPFSDGPLIYKRTEDNFKLYSVGEDFIDNEGVVRFDEIAIAGLESGIGLPMGFSGSASPIRADLIYWPTQATLKKREIALRGIYRQVLQSEETDYPALFLELQKLDALLGVSNPDELKQKIEAKKELLRQQRERTPQGSLMF